MSKFSNVGKGRDLNLQNLLCEEAITMVNDWQGFGLALGVNKHELERIDEECRGKIKACRREMLSERIKSTPLLTWEIVRVALDDIEMSKENFEKEGTKFQQAIVQLENSIPKMKASDQRIDREKQKLEMSLSAEQKEWQNTQDDWKSEDEKWERERESRGRIKAALHANPISQLVKEVLHENGCDEALNKLQTQAYLSSVIQKKQTRRSKELRSRYKTTKDHKKQVQKLRKEYVEWQNLVDQRIVTYEKLLYLMKQLGASEEKVQALKKQLVDLKDTFEKLTSAENEIDRVLKNRKRSITDCERDLQLFLESFEAVLGETQNSQRLQMLKAGTAVIVGSVSGAAVGSAAGTAVLPVFGTAVGAGVGAVYAMWKGWFAEDKILRDFKHSSISAQNELKELRRMGF